MAVDSKTWQWDFGVGNWDKQKVPSIPSCLQMCSWLSISFFLSRIDWTLPWKNYEKIIKIWLQEFDGLYLYKCRSYWFWLSEREKEELGSEPFNSQDLISNSCYCLSYSSCGVGEFGIGSTYNLLIDIFLHSHHLSAWYYIDIVRRNSVLVTHGS